MKFNIVFESTDTNDYVGVLVDTVVPNLLIAAQNAGSINASDEDKYDLYYLVGGGGVNGFFHTALGDSLTKTVNADLVAAYDARFGKGSWRKDHSNPAPPLTSFYIPLPANASKLSGKIGKRVVGMVYSVGPDLSGRPFTDRSQYQKVYADALSCLIEGNKRAEAAGDKKIDGLRLTMVSTGIYAPNDNPEQFRAEAAGLILDAIEAAANGPDGAYLPSTFLVNCGTTRHAPPVSDSRYELDGFTAAAEARKI